MELLLAMGNGVFSPQNSMKSQITFEVRMTACDRPGMLRRALKSLQAQNYPYWRAIVFDDSLSSEPREVVQGMSDRRISYIRNPQRFGAARNIDQCFSPTRLSDGSHACLLEDDNFWLPEFLSLISDHLGKRSWELILANQRISEEGASLRPASETTRGGWFSAGRVDALDLRAMLLLMEGLSNGGLIWRLDGQTNLQVGSTVQETGLHEACRSLLIGVPFLFVEEPLAVWTLMPKSESARAVERNRLIGRGMQSIRDFVLHLHGECAVRIARRIASKLDLTDRLVEALSYSGHPTVTGESHRGRHRLVCRALAKGWAARIFERDPCAAFLNSGRIPPISDPA